MFPGRTRTVSVSHQSAVPENCRLVAHNTGDGWALVVENRDRDVVCYLAWPKNWPDWLTAADLECFGFEVV